MIHHYFLMLKDLKGEDHNVVIVNGYEPEQREAAFAALKALQALCGETTEAWIDVEAWEPTDGIAATVDAICRQRGR